MDLAKHLNAIVFGLVSGFIVLYILYMIVRKRKGLRPGQMDREPEI